MAEFDFSSYPKPPTDNRSIADRIKEWGSVEQQQISISQAKLKQVNDQFQLMNEELSILADPEGNNGQPYTKQQAAQRLTTFAKTYNFKPEVVNHMLGELNQAPNVPTFARTAALRGIANLERLNKLYGVPGISSTGQTDTPVVTSNVLNRGVPRPVGPPIQVQAPPTISTVDAEGRPRLLGPQPPALAPGTVSQPTPFPVTRPAPVQNLGPGSSPKPLPIDAGRNNPIEPPNTFAERFPQPTGPATGQSPLFAQGLAEYTKDQSDASARASSIKPLIETIPLIQAKGFMSGPGTDAFTKAVAAAKTWGLLDIAENADPTAIRQDVNKKLAQYITRSPVANRSDASQALSEAASPNAKTQIQPALLKLVKDAVALERVQIAMPNAFTGKDYDNYIKHKGTFPQSVDEKAFALDLEEDGGKKIIKEMRARYDKNKNDAKALKFFRSLDIAAKQGFYQ